MLKEAIKQHNKYTDQNKRISSSVIYLTTTEVSKGETVQGCPSLSQSERDKSSFNRHCNTHHRINRIFFPCWSLGTSSSTGMARVTSVILRQIRKKKTILRTTIFTRPLMCVILPSFLGASVTGTLRHSQFGRCAVHQLWPLKSAHCSYHHKTNESRLVNEAEVMWPGYWCGTRWTHRPLWFPSSKMQIRYSTSSANRGLKVTSLWDLMWQADSINTLPSPGAHSSVDTKQAVHTWGLLHKTS